MDLTKIEEITYVKFPVPRQRISRCFVRVLCRMHCPCITFPVAAQYNAGESRMFHNPTSTFDCVLGTTCSSAEYLNMLHRTTTCPILIDPFPRSLSQRPPVSLKINDPISNTSLVVRMIQRDSLCVIRGRIHILHSHIQVSLFIVWNLKHVGSARVARVARGSSRRVGGLGGRSFGARQPVSIIHNH